MIWRLSLSGVGRASAYASPGLNLAACHCPASSLYVKGMFCLYKITISKGEERAVRIGSNFKACVWFFHTDLT